MTHTIGMISLGCAKNQVNAEQMLYLLRQAGYEILPDPDGAELVIINTCGFIDSAKEEAIDHILAMGALKQEGRVGKILVTGCLAQRYQEEIVNEMPEVDGVLGTGSYYDIVHAAKEILDGKKYERFDDISAPLNEPGRILTTRSSMPISRSPRAVTTIARSASFRSCAAITAAGRWRS